ncbi:hypothetical protein SUDANB176_00260 [Streptomyces sp. enrichment culture]|uniref:SDR family NAD(P)-dependent oxidoreductase n=1 Tax=Streptomyces sp. enrichment culture TaxID=1795815 RepID=UPI003F54E981
MRATAGRNAPAAAALAQSKKDHGIRTAAVEMDVREQESVDAVVNQVMAEQGRIDVVAHSAGHMVLGSAEAFTRARLAGVNVLSTQRVNRAVPPAVRHRQRGLLVRVGSFRPRRTPALPGARSTRARPRADPRTAPVVF